MEGYSKLYEKCELCPHKCGINRFKYTSYCSSTNEVKISALSYYKGEEPCFYVDSGVGAIFFSNCTMKCVYCQNFAFSQLGNGKVLTEEQLTDMIMEVNQKSNYLELVTPTHFLPSILTSLYDAKSLGFNLPVIYNTSGYESIETLKLLNGNVDIYLVDFRYSDNIAAKRYSGVNDYFDIVKDAILQMHSQVGNLILDNQGRAVKGVLIRYLVLPNHINDHTIVFDWIYDNLGKFATISIMDQYVPVYKAKNIDLLNSYVSKDYYREVVNYAVNKGFENLYIQTRLLSKE